MARRCFFSFHYERDVWRAGQVRNSWVTQGRSAAGFWDAAAWESVKRGGDAAIKRWIRDQMKGTSVTVVLIGARTSERDYVLYELQKSHENGKGLLGVYIHGMRDQQGDTDYQGDNPFDHVWEEEGTRRHYLSRLYRTYDWVLDDGYSNLGYWIELAAVEAGR